MLFSEYADRNREEWRKMSAVDPEVFGFALMSSPFITNGVVTLVTQFTNLLKTEYTIDWVNSHLFKVTVTDALGNAFDVETLLPPALPQTPTTLKSGGTLRTIFTVDT